jgi:8-oxo-dGTP pyrophosphatase MutT (NUDIX family)
VLLFQYSDQRSTWWATPGGALEGSETFEEAAAREAQEELGLTQVTFDPLWDRTTEFESRGILIRQTERYFLVDRKGSDITLGREVRDAHDAEGILALKWWLPSEIDLTRERVFPEDLLARLHAMFEVADQ